MDKKIENCLKAMQELRSIIQTEPDPANWEEYRQALAVAITASEESSLSLIEFVKASSLNVQPANPPAAPEVTDVPAKDDVQKEPESSGYWAKLGFFAGVEVKESSEEDGVTTENKSGLSAGIQLEAGITKISNDDEETTTVTLGAKAAVTEVTTATVKTPQDETSQTSSKSTTVSAKTQATTSSSESAAKKAKKE